MDFIEVVRKRRIRVYIEGIKNGAIQKRFGVRKLTVAFTTFAGERRLQQMRQWTLEELEKEALDVGSVFAFRSLSERPRPQMWLESCWFLAYDQSAFSMLGV